MKTWAALVALSLTPSCAPLPPIAKVARPPVCVRGGAEPVEMSMEDYGSTYTEGMNGPAASAPPSYLIPESEAGADCVAPPWWQSH